MASFVHEQNRGQTKTLKQELTIEQKNLFNLDQAYQQMIYYIAVLAFDRNVKSLFLQSMMKPD